MKLLKLNSKQYIVVHDDYQRSAELMIDGSVRNAFSSSEDGYISFYGWRDNNDEQIEAYKKAEFVVSGNLKTIKRWFNTRSSNLENESLKEDEGEEMVQIVENDLFINGTKIDGHILCEFDYEFIERERRVDYLISWIAQSKNYTDIYQMKKSLLALMIIDDGYVIIDRHNNETFSLTNDRDKFKQICGALVEQNEKNKKD